MDTTFSCRINPGLIVVALSPSLSPLLCVYLDSSILSSHLLSNVEVKREPIFSDLCNIPACLERRKKDLFLEGFKPINFIIEVNHLL